MPTSEAGAVRVRMESGPALPLLAAWEMNERKGDVLRDGSGNGFGGRIGRHVRLNGRFHHFPLVSHEVEERVPGHIDVVPDSDALELRNRDFSVIAKVRYGRDWDRNIIQKGQGSPTGGIFKMKISHKSGRGLVTCLVRGGAGNAWVVSKDHGDGKWHTIRCTRTSEGVTLVVDGKVEGFNDGPTGFIDNNWPVAIGGNTFCWEGQAKRCNYWHGDIDFIRIRAG